VVEKVLKEFLSIQEVTNNDESQRMFNELYQGKTT
jgi:hypothetical protein